MAQISLCSFIGNPEQLDAAEPSFGTAVYIVVAFTSSSAYFRKFCDSICLSPIEIKQTDQTRSDKQTDRQTDRQFMEKLNNDGALLLVCKNMFSTMEQPVGISRVNFLRVGTNTCTCRRKSLAI